MDRLEKKTVLITGASSGMGEATAIRLRNAGYEVYAAARRVERMEHLKDLGIHAIHLDVTDDDSMVAAVEGIIADRGTVDILVNNAGYGSYGAVEEVPMSEARHQMDVNLFGLARMSQLVIPGMRQRKYGKIINISSIGGKIHEALGGWYHASKYAVEGLSDCMRAELRDFGIDVVVIEPGAIQTEWSGIAAETLLAASGDGPYKEAATKHAGIFRGPFLNASKKNTSPDVVARAVQKAITAKTPKTRYAVGQLAKASIFARHILSDRMMDRLMTRVLG